MGTRVPFSFVGVGLLMVIMVSVSRVNSALVCNFGPENIPDLVLRNNTYTNLTNTFLYNFAYTTRDKIRRVSTFDLVDYLITGLGWDLTNQSYHVSYGALLQINWTAVTQTYKSNVTLPGYIQANYTDVIHGQMQFYANFYAMSYGIYRPKPLQFYYSGIDTAFNTDHLVPQACSAGYRIVLQIPTNMSYPVALSNPNSTNYATFASMLETSFDQFFRISLSAFTNDFVRVNLWTATTAMYSFLGYQVTAYIEVFFQKTNNATYVRDCVVQNISLLPPLTFLNYPVYVMTSNISVYGTAIAGPNTLTTPSTTEAIKSTLTTTKLATSTTAFTNSSTASTAAVTNTTLPPSTTIRQNGTQIGLTTISNARSSSTLNTTQFNTSTTVGNATTLNSKATTSHSNHSSTVATTFDADPLFFATAPVFPKKYNDPVMVPIIKHSESMQPLQIQEAFLKITLPVAAGIVGSILALLLCLQSDWLPKPTKATVP